MFRIPPITKNLLVINVLLFFAARLLENNGIDLNNVLGLHFIKSEAFMPYQLVTYMFMHANFEHIFFNMLAFWMFGRILEQVWGPRRYLLFYFVCGIGAGICQEIVQYIDYVSQGLNQYEMVTNGSVKISMAQYLNGWTTVGASGAVYGILLGFGMSFPNERVFLLIPPIPLKAKYLVMGYAVIELLSGLSTSNSGVAHFAHLGGMLFGFGLILYWRRIARRREYGFSSWSEYKPKEPSFWDRLKSKSKSGRRSTFHRSDNSQFKQDNTATRQDTATPKDTLSERKARQEEIERILDKVKKSGYACLTEEEKKKIFDFRNN